MVKIFNNRLITFLFLCIFLIPQLVVAEDEDLVFFGSPNPSTITISAFVTVAPSSGANISINSVVTGQTELPEGSTNIVLTNTAVLDLSAGLSSGAVILESGIDGQPVVLTNSNLSGIIANIPDGTRIQGFTGWDGKIAPPVATSSIGNAPAGFSVGSNVISIGSPEGTLVFDNPVTILFTDVTGTMGYKPSGSNTWVRIINSCGTYATPTPPTYGGQCVTSNGNDTKIVTYHFTSFGPLTAISSGGGGGGGGGSSSSNDTSTTMPTVVNFSGMAYPSSKVTILNNGKVAVTTVADPSARFSVSLNDLKTGTYNFSVFGNDINGVKSLTFSFPVYVTSGTTVNIGGIFLSPTINTDKSEVKKGDVLVVFGQTIPNTDLGIIFHSDQEILKNTKTDGRGMYKYNMDTTPLEYGDHIVESRATTEDTIVTSNEAPFIVGLISKLKDNKLTSVLPSKGDINKDNKVNLVDFSVAAFWFKKLNPPASVDLNGDGKVNLVDFSIMAFNWTG